ncbi:Uncharacterised protein [Amycolatopsis camponoti]|uniref:Uncharacterized protein n=1 Tax=Amycolatopsis camponoti TaxID=2606593 RepID=A0A6I8LPH1_9PSEU|nr:Uncharacterised protein [Amycolatopsis camponoti]
MTGFIGRTLAAAEQRTTARPATANLFESPPPPNTDPR